MTNVTLKKIVRQMITLAFCLSLVVNTAFATAYDSESLKEEISSHLIQWESQFDVTYEGILNDTVIENLKPSINEAMHIVPYIANNLDRYAVSMAYSSKEAKLSFEVTYLSDLEKENALDDKLETAIKTLNLKGVSDYEKVKRISDWISDHFSYDESLTIYAASEMSEKGTGVCQAYASMFYKMAKAAGIEVVYQDGNLNGSAHLWNLVNIAGKWYHVDVTNYDGNDRRILMMVGTEELKPLVYSYTPPSFVIESYSFNIDKTYNNGLYDETLIGQRLKLNPYKSGGFTPTYAYNQGVVAIYYSLDSLSGKLMNQPTKALYNELRQTISKAAVFGLDTERYSAMADQISLSQYQLAKDTMNQATLKVKALKGSKFTEKNALAALKLVEETRTKVAKINILDSHTQYLDAQVSSIGKEPAQYLLQLYYGQYKKTGSSSWLTKIKSINGKYGITINIK